MPQGELISVSERMIVAPGVGVFRPAAPPVDIDLTDAYIDEGQEIGVLEGPGTRVPVRSPFRGMLIGMLAFPGERLRTGQPVAWLRVA